MGSDNLDVKQFNRRSFPVDAVRVTEENFEDVAVWCDGNIHLSDETDQPVAIGTRYIKVRVQNPLSERQTKAFVGDWVLYAGKGYKVYTDKAFKKSFDETTQNVFDHSVPLGNSTSTVRAIGGGGGSANPGGTHIVGKGGS